MKHLSLNISVLALLLIILPIGAAAVDIYDQPLRTDTNIPELGIQPRGVAAVDTTFLAYFTFDDGGLCYEDGWTSVDLSGNGVPGLGDFAALYPGITLLQVDPCASELDCVWGFFSGSTDNYGCGGYPAQTAVPMGGPSGYIRNEVWSPPIDWTGAGPAAEFRFDVYRDLPLDNLVFYTWRVRSLTAGVPGEWRSRDIAYYSPGRDWLRCTFKFGDLVEQGADQIQIAIGLVDMYPSWNGILGSGACHSHAPILDDVEVYRVDSPGPRWFVHSVDLFQDNFSADGTITGTVRMDAARDILPRSSAGIRPGDSISVNVAEPVVGLGYHQTGVENSGPAVYLHVQDVSPAKSGGAISGDPSRWPLVSTGGGWTVIQFDSVRTGAKYGVRDRFCVDLNDNLFTPGDTINFFFSAHDKLGRTSYWSEYAPTPSAVSSASLEDHAMEATCLPAVALWKRALLYVDDTDFRGAQPFVDSALLQMRMLDEVDRYDVRGASYLAGNGPGSRVVNVANQLNDNYKFIIWNSGGLSAGLVGDGSGHPEKSPDAQMLVQFLNGDGWINGLYISGDDVAEEWAALNTPAINDLKSFMDHTLVKADHVRRVGISPLVCGEPCGPFEDSFGIDTLVAYGGCPQINKFDIIEPAGDAELGMSYHGKGSTGGAVVYQESIAPSGSVARAVLSGFSFHYIRDSRAMGIPQRSEHLYRIVKYLDPDIPFPGVGPWMNLTAEGSGMRVTWRVEARCNTYRGVNVYRRASDSVPKTLLNKNGPVPLEEDYLDRTVEPGRWYRYSIGVVRGDSTEYGSMEKGIPVKFRFHQFSVTVLAAGVELKWAARSTEPIRMFTVFRRGPGEDLFTRLPDARELAASTTRFVDKTAKPGVVYEYKVSALLESYDTFDTDVGEVAAPAAVALAQNVPNPFNPATVIAFNLSENAQTRLEIYDVKGRLVRILVNETRPAGYNEADWDGLNQSGEPAASGVYFCRLETSGQVHSRKMALLR